MSMDEQAAKRAHDAEMEALEKRLALNRQLAEMLGWRVLSEIDVEDEWTYRLVDPFGAFVVAWHNGGHPVFHVESEDEAWELAPNFCGDLNAVAAQCSCLFVEKDEDGKWGADVNFDFIQPRVIAEGDTPSEAAAAALMQSLLWKAEYEAEQAEEDAQVQAAAQHGGVEEGNGDER